MKKNEFEKILSRLSPRLRAISRRLDGRFTFFDEDDLYQEAAIHLYKRYRDIPSRKDTDSFILQGGMMHMKNYIRTSWKKTDQRRVALETETMDAVLTESPEEPGGALSGWTGNMLDKEELELASLILEGLTAREMGKRMGISHVAVIKKIRKIRERLGSGDDKPRT